VLTARARRPPPAPQQVTPSVHVLTLGRGAAASNVYLVGSDAAWTLVDAGWASSAEAIRTGAESVFGPGARPAAIVLTHIHPDHSGSAGTLARSWEVPVYVGADERNEPRYNPGMVRAEMLTPGPVGLGSRFRAEMRTWPRPVVMSVEFTGYDRPRRLASTTRLSTMDIQGTLTFDPVPVGTRMRWSWQMRPRGLLKLLTLVMAGIGRRQEEAIWTGLKEVR